MTTSYGTGDRAKATKLRPKIRRLRDGEAPPRGIEPGRYRNASGYIRLRWRVSADELVECYEHRWVAGAQAGEQVHHVNGVKDDNRPENLRKLTSGEHGRTHNPEQVDIDTIARLYTAGFSTPEIAEHLGVHAATAYRTLIRHGYKPRSIGESLRKLLPDEVIRDLHLAGVRSRRIAKALCVAPSTIDTRVRLMGLPAHRPGRPTAAEIRRAEALVDAVVVP